MRSTLAAIAAAVLAAAVTVPLAASAAGPAATACNVTARFTGPVNSARIRVTGECGGHAPTAAQMKRLAAPLVLPAWLHTGRVRRYGECHGKGVRVWQTPRPGANGTSAVHCRSGRTFLS